MKPEVVSATFIQMKNDRSYIANIRTSLFTEMDFFKVGLFSKGENDVYPIICMVFALASFSSVKAKEPPRPAHFTGGSKKNDNYTAHDIWVAGATNLSFGVIELSENGTDTKLLERSCKIFDGYDLIDKAALLLKRRSNNVSAQDARCTMELLQKVNITKIMFRPKFYLDDSEEMEPFTS